MHLLPDHRGQGRDAGSTAAAGGGAAVWVRHLPFVRDMRTQSAMSQAALEDASGIGQAEISRYESGSMERGPSLLTLVRLAHAAGKRLVIGIEDEEGENKESTRVLTL